MKDQEISHIDGTRCAVKVARTVWSGGKSGDSIKGLPIAMQNLS
jgi:hypothetical protein